MPDHGIVSRIRTQGAVPFPVSTVRAFAGVAPGRHGFRKRDLPMSRVRSSRWIRMRGRAEKGEWIAENPECSVAVSGSTLR